MNAMPSSLCNAVAKNTRVRISTPGSATTRLLSRLQDSGCSETRLLKSMPTWV